MDQDIRWHQRFSNYRKALKKLSSAIDLIKANGSEKDDDTDDLEGVFEVESDDTDDLEDVLKEGLIQRFEYTFELAWNVMKDFEEFQGITVVSTPRLAIMEAFRIDIIEDGEMWMEMMKSRHLTSHTYNSETAEEIFTKIVNNYHLLFLKLEAKMEQLRS